MAKAIGAAVAALVVLAAAQAARADDLAVTGKWSGTFENSKGDKGSDALRVREHKGGVLKGTWDGMELTGHRLGRDVFLCKASGSGRNYEAVIRVSRDGGRVTVDYRVTYEGSGDDGAYTGTSHMKPAD